MAGGDGDGAGDQTSGLTEGQLEGAVVDRATRLPSGLAHLLEGLD